MLAVSEAVDGVYQMRIREGEIIKESLTKIAESIENGILNLESKVDIIFNEYITYLQNRVKELLVENNLDENEFRTDYFIRSEN